MNKKTNYDVALFFKKQQQQPNNSSGCRCGKFNLKGLCPKSGALKQLYFSA